MGVHVELLALEGVSAYAILHSSRPTSIPGDMRRSSYAEVERWLYPMITQTLTEMLVEVAVVVCCYLLVIPRRCCYCCCC